MLKSNEWPEHLPFASSFRGAVQEKTDPGVNFHQSWPLQIFNHPNKRKPSIAQIAWGGFIMSKKCPNNTTSIHIYSLSRSIAKGLSAMLLWRHLVSICFLFQISSPRKDLDVQWDKILELGCFQRYHSQLVWRMWSNLHKVMVLWSLPKDLSENIKNVRKYVLETGEMILRVLTSRSAGMGWEIPGISKF